VFSLPHRLPRLRRHLSAAAEKQKAKIGLLEAACGDMVERTVSPHVYVGTSHWKKCPHKHAFMLAARLDFRPKPGRGIFCLMKIKIESYPI